MSSLEKLKCKMFIWNRFPEKTLRQHGMLMVTESFLVAEPSWIYSHLQNDLRSQKKERSWCCSVFRLLPANHSCLSALQAPFKHLNRSESDLLSWSFPNTPVFSWGSSFFSPCEIITAEALLQLIDWTDHVEGGWDSFKGKCDETQEKEGWSHVSVQVFFFFSSVQMHMKMSADTFWEVGMVC